jgi:hypothetical protein
MRSKDWARALLVLVLATSAHAQSYGTGGSNSGLHDDIEVRLVRGYEDTWRISSIGRVYHARTRPSASDARAMLRGETPQGWRRSHGGGSGVFIDFWPAEHRSSGGGNTSGENSDPRLRSEGRHRWVLSNRVSVAGPRPTRAEVDAFLAGRTPAGWRKRPAGSGSGGSGPGPAEFHAEGFDERTGRVAGTGGQQGVRFLGVDSKR